MPDLIGSMKIWFESRTTVCFLSLQSHELLLFERFPVDWPCFAIVLLRIEIIVLYESIKWRVSMVGGGGYQGESDHQFNPAMAPFWELGVRGGIYTWDWQIDVIIIVICLFSWDSLYSVSSSSLPLQHYLLCRRQSQFFFQFLHCFSSLPFLRLILLFITIINFQNPRTDRLSNLVSARFQWMIQGRKWPITLFFPKSNIEQILSESHLSSSVHSSSIPFSLLYICNRRQCMRKYL